MAKAKVYFTDLRTREYGDGLPKKLQTLIRAAGIGNIDMDGKFVAIKTHFGELGNVAFLRPNFSKAVADVVKFLISRPDISGIVHGTCENQCTWYEFAKEVKRLLGDRFVREVVPCTTDEFPRPARRPRNSALKKSVLNVLGYRTPDWKAALAEFVADEFRS